MENRTYRNRERKFSMHSRVRSILFAWQGLARFFKEEHNARVHLFATIFVTGMGCIYRLSSSEWLVVVMLTGAVWVTEIINTAIERTMDHLSPHHHAEVKYIKDLAAAAVLIACAVAVIAGVLLFIPKILF